MATPTTENHINAGMGSAEITIKPDPTNRSISGVVAASIDVIRNTPLANPIADSDDLP